MFQAALWGGVASLSLLIGAFMAIFFHIPKKVVAFIMALGTGLIIGSATFDLLSEAEGKADLVYLISMFLLGALIFTLFEMFISKKGGSERKRSKKNPHGHSGLAIYVGTIMDAIPESIIIGVSFIESQSMQWVFIIAIFISNLPESLSSSIGLKLDHYSTKKILYLWGSVVILSSFSSLLGYTLLQNAPESTSYIIGAFGAGGLLAMASSTMMPEAYEEGGPIVGFLSSLGIILSFVLTHMS
ncbi:MULTISPECIES: ZIP family metal transporter [Rossellomorea]|uniref:ZIP family metal transporter n=1 Tax=Rossellomorea TaxID=2837508 RepID=UPI001CCC8D28|nr:MULTISPECIES: ZIP family metal transporter [Rossellomorea]MCA0148072.1 ZIP family metal transporter [Rossellomorea vietnamensis]WGG43741.1 ZIP family metal transporter [Rossellomorea sp. DA94]